MANKWQVDHIHINVGKGDCAIHLLVDTSTVNGSGVATRTVQGAVLIDGGQRRNPSGSAPKKSKAAKTANVDTVTLDEPLESTMTWINTKYVFPPNSDGTAGNLRFDSMVISHWDADHHASLVQMLWTDVSNANAANQKQLSYIKYDTTSGLPVTCLYAPIFKDQGKNNNGAPLTVTQTVDATNKENWLVVTSSPTFFLAKVRTTDPIAIKKQTSGTALFNVLGVNFFNNNPIPDAQQAQLHTPSLLLTQNPPGSDGRPGLYCIGAVKKALQTVATMPMIIKEGVTPTNQNSLAEVLLWPDGRMSYWAAGDAPEIYETSYVNWSQTNGAKSITTVKLGHHGSRSSTPLTMLTTLKPQNVMIFNPNGGDFHPGWETVLYWSIWLRQNAANATRPLGLYATKFPHWLAQNSSGDFTNLESSKGLNITAFTASKPSAKINSFRQFLNNSYSTFNSAGLAVSNQTDFKAFTTAVQGKTVQEQRVWVAQQLLAIWNLYGFPSTVTHPGTTTAYTLPALQMGNTASQMDLVGVTSTSDSTTDGSVWFKRRSNDTAYTLPPKATPTAATASTTATLTPANTAGPPISFVALPPGAPTPPITPDITPPITPTAVTNFDTRAGKQINLFDAALSAAVPTVSALGQKGVVAPTFINVPETDPNEADDYDGTEYDSDGGSDGTSDDGSNVGDDENDSLAIAQREYESSLKNNQRIIQRDVSVGDPAPSAYCYYASTVASTSIKVAGTNLTAGSPIDGFVTYLHCSVVSLTAQLTASNAAPSVGLVPQVALAGTDEWACWLSDAISATEMSASNNGGSFGGFSFAINLKDAVSNVILLSSTSAMYDTFKITPSTTRALSMGLADTAVMVFGLVLDSIAGDSLYFSTILEYAGLTGRFDNNLLSTLGAIKLKIPSASSDTGNRNAVWFDAATAYQTTVRLQFDLDDTTKVLQSWLSSLPSITVKDVYLICKKKCHWSSDDKGVSVMNDGELILVADILVQVNSTLTLEFETVIDFHGNITTVEFTLNSQDDAAFDGILSWLAGLAGGSPDFSFKDLPSQKPAGSTSFGQFVPRRITVDLVSPAMGNGSPSFSTFRFDMEASLHFASGQTALFLVYYQYSVGAGSMVEADLWTAPPFDPADPTTAALLSLQPDYETFRYLKPLTVAHDQLLPYLDLAELGGFDNLPQEIPTHLSEAFIRADSNGIGFSGRILANAPTTNPDLPSITLGELSLQVTYAWGTSYSQSSIDAVFAMTAMISPPPGNTVGGPAMIEGAIAFDSSSQSSQWSLSASVQNLSGASIFQFFDGDSQNAVIHLIESILIRNLYVNYTYVSGGGASSFNITGEIDIGDLIFNLNFDNTGSGWDFYATLSFPVGIESQTTTLGSMLSGIVGTTFDIQDLPSFITDIQVTIDTKNQSNAGLAIVKTKDPSSGTATGVFFTVWVDILGLTFQYLQFCNFSDIVAGQTPAYKRIFLVSLAPVNPPDIPLVGSVPQPFDEALFMWVQPQQGWTGMTSKDITAINDQIKDLQSYWSEAKPIPFKSLTENPPDTAILIQPGMHFMLVLKGNDGTPNCDLDYAFANDSTTNTPAAVSETNGRENDVDDAPPAATSNNNGSAMTAYQKTLGPLSVSNIGFSYTSGANGGGGILAIKLDASIVLGPVGYALKGFALTLDFAGQNSSGNGPATLQDLPSIGFNLDGMAASFDRPPVDFSGVFIRGTSTTQTYYEGGATLAFAPWAFQAAGYYGEIAATANSAAFKSAFVYCILNGPLVELEFATISGICGGFGYNSNLKFPNASNVPQFPLMAQPLASTTAATMQSLLSTQWFMPQDQSFWLAAGLTVNAFEMLNIQAVVVVEWDPKVMLGIFGLATADVPAGSPEKFAHVQLGLVATVDFNAGVMKIDGQLTPQSYILAPSCHLTGGFALYSWFDSSDPSLEGDWVFTIGGYHQAFVPPPQYPVPPRLAISWQFDDSISISGQAYFAICPKVCMGGGRLDVSMSAGPLYAYFDAFADFLIQFRPFYFTADGGVKVGVKFTMDLWIATVHISVELSATLHLEGPPLHGSVYVDFYVFGFTVRFGDSGSSNNARLFLQDFYDLVLQSSTSSTAQMMAALATPTPSKKEVADENNSPAPHVFIPQTGQIPADQSKSTPSGDVWNVRGAVFSFMLSCKFAFTQATVTTTQLGGKDPIDSSVDSTGASTILYSKPMQVNQQTGPLVSTIDVTITYTPPASAIANSSGEDASIAVPTWSNNKAAIKALPAGLWGEYIQDEDPSTPGSNVTNLLQGSTAKTISLMAGISISAPVAVVSTDAIAEFNVQAQMIENVSDPNLRPFPTFLSASVAWTPAQPDPVLSKQLAAVSTAWNAAQKIPADLTVGSLWPSDFFGWAPTQTQPTSLVPDTSVPDRFVPDLDEYYVYAPLLSDIA